MAREEDPGAQTRGPPPPGRPDHSCRRGAKWGVRPARPPGSQGGGDAPARRRGRGASAPRGKKFKARMGGEVPMRNLVLCSHTLSFSDCHVISLLF